MAGIGRNQTCPCGSGAKFKHCHGSIWPEANLRLDAPAVEDVIKRHASQEFQRKRQQGRGRSIVSADVGGTRFVAVGNSFFIGKWPTFKDFILHYVKMRLGMDWGRREVAKPAAERHPFLRWLEVLGDLMERHTTNPVGMNSMPEYGAVRAVFGLAYDLYVMEHHIQNEDDQRALERILHRLRQKDQFVGARHELRVARMFLLAGFDLSWEREEERHSGGYAEFIATFPQTGRAFWVECKMRQSENEKSERFTSLVTSALQKRTTLERFVCVELSLARMRPIIDDEDGGWSAWAVNQLRTLEQQPSSSSLPKALVMLSNFSEHRHLDEVVQGAGMILEGFKTSAEEYRLGETITLLEAVERRERDVEIESLWRSAQEHSVIPTSFDGSIPWIDESRRLIIGNAYELDDGDVGVLEEATVVEQWRQAVAILRQEDGKRIVVRFGLSDEEMDAWRRYPETFFGELRHQPKSAKNPIDLYDFFFESYVDTPKDLLLKWMCSHSDIEELRTLSQPELVKRYAYRSAAAVAQRSPSVTPKWQRRIRRPPRS